MKIERDQPRFKQIVRGKIRENLRKYVTHGEMIGRKGSDLVSIPVPQLDVPHFRFGKNGSGGVGQGDGEVGHADRPRRRRRDGAGQAGERPGRPHPRSRALARRTGRRSSARSWSCRASSPRARPTSSRRRTSTPASARPGPRSLRHFKRTYMQALKRQIASSTYDPDDPRVIPIREDKQYRSWNDGRRSRRPTRSSST